MHHAGRIRINISCYSSVLNQQERTSTYVHILVRGHAAWVHYFKKPKSSPAAAAAVAAATTTATIAVAAAVGHTSPGSASLHARLVGLTLAPFVLVLVLVVDFCWMFPASHLEIRPDSLETRNLQPT